MKVVTILGTRPEIIRLSRIIPALDVECEHFVVHTGQNYDDRLSSIFFSGLGVRDADVWLGVREDSFGQQVGKIISSVETVLLRERPDRVLILGDTNSGLGAFVACRLGIPVYHLEAGNRCFDDRVPEEVNRRVIDHSSSVLMAYTERSRENLLREGIEGHRIHVVGNPILEVIDSQEDAIRDSDVLERFGLSPRGYLVATTHRQENVDVEERLRAIAASLAAASSECSVPIVWSVHPRTRARLEASGIRPDPAAIQIIEPLGFADFIALERAARGVLTDSGTVQEECCILMVPSVTLRDVTERPETVDCGSNILAGVDPPDVVRALRAALRDPPAWTPPPEYMLRHVSATVTRIVLGFRADH